MNTPFLTQVARHYAGAADALLFVLPNRRSLVHFRKEAEAAGLVGRGHRSVTVDTLVRRIAGNVPSEKTALLLELYAAWREVGRDDESLDSFLPWASVILGDFDDIDRNRVNANLVFAPADNLSDEQRFAMDASQREVLGRLGALLRDGSHHAMQERFARDWGLLAPLYHAFRTRLAAKGMAYGGLVYRMAANRAVTDGGRAALAGGGFGGLKVVFAGLNALSESEKALMRTLRDEGLAEFVWDLCSSEIRNSANAASRAVAGNMQEFPQAFALEEVTTRPAVKVVAVPSGVGLAKLAPAFLSDRAGEPEDTALVLPDEGLLMPLLSAIPAEAGDVNVTMGYPLSRTPAVSLVSALGELQLTARRNSDGDDFYYRSAMDVVSHPLVDAVLDNAEKESVRNVRAEARARVNAASLQAGPTLSLLFSAILDDAHQASGQQNSRLGTYIDSVLMHVGRILAGAPSPELFALETLRRCHEVVVPFAELDFPVLPATWLASLGAALRQESVPFDGEPLRGLQVMGFLETRALDFRNIAVLGANEDVLPRRTPVPSAIPQDVRAAFGLPTAREREAVQAYHFYRLIQRAETVWIAYDSRTEGLHSGEESRYVKQLEYLYGFPLERVAAVAPVTAVPVADAIPKTQEDIDTLRGRHLSASSMQAYLSCPAKFYYHAVKGLKTAPDAAETLDAAMFGTAFHAVMEGLYSGRRTVGTAELRAWLADQDTLRSRVEDAVREVMRTDDVSGRNTVVVEVILAYVEGAIRHDLDILASSGRKEFRILGLERRMEAEVGGFRFIGYLDRIDSFRDGEVRIVDYKTGRVENDDILIADANAEAVCKKLFGESNASRPKIALQLFLYGTFARNGLLREGERVVNSIYSTARLVTDPLPDVPESPKFRALVQESLENTLREIADTSVPWKRTCDKATCGCCDFRSICGR